MKCPECEHNQLRGQHGMKCKSCGYQFIFDPKSHYCGSKRMTDGYFIKCIDKISRNNTYFYTEDELYCYMAQKTKSSFIGCFFLTIFLSVFITAFLHTIFDTGMLPAFILFTIFTLLNIYISRKALSRRRWNKYLKRWKTQTILYKHQKDVLAGLISEPQLIEQPSSTSEQDIYEYGAGKLLICEHDIQVDWLVKNQFHTQNGVVVMAESGYPHYLTDKVKSLIESNPSLEIYLLHNAGKQGESMVSRVTNPTSKWNLSQRSYFDLGLTMDLLRKTGVKKNVIEQYRDNFPVHGLNYHNANRLLSHSITAGVTLGAAMSAFTADGDTGISCDFG